MDSQIQSDNPEFIGSKHNVKYEIRNVHIYMSFLTLPEKQLYD